MASMIEYICPKGKSTPGYLSPASQSGAPGVVMFAEWWGLDDRIKATADRLATQGFTVLVPDLFDGQSALTPDEATHLVEGLDFADAASQDAVGASLYLRNQGAKRVGVMGFCIGGALAMLAAMQPGALDAASTWYGLPPPDAGDPSTISIPLQGHWALHDDFYPSAAVNALESKLEAAGKKPEFYQYDAQHGFFNTGALGQGGLDHYNPAAAELAWSRTVDFFNRTLRS